MDTLKRAKKEFQKRVLLPIAGSIKIKTHPKVSSEDANNFNKLADLSNLNLNHIEQNVCDTKEENSETSHEISHNDDNSDEHISFNLSRVDKFKTEIYKDITYILKLYGITSDDNRNNKKHESSNENSLLSPYINDAFSKIMDINSIHCNETNKIYDKIKEQFSPKSAIEIYAALVQILVKHEASAFSYYKWSEEFSFEAETILKLYAEYQSLDELYISYAKWIAYTEIYQFAVLNPGLFEKILDDLILKQKCHSKSKTAKKIKKKILKQFKNKPKSEKAQDSNLYTLKFSQNLTKDEVKHSTEISNETSQNVELTAIFWNSANILSQSFLNFVHELHLTTTHRTTDTNLEILEKTSLIFKRLASIQPSQIDQLDFESNFKEALIDGTIDYFIQNINHKLLAQSEENIERMDELINILKKAAEYIRNFDDKFGPFFKLSYNISIPELFHHAYDPHLVNLIHPVISDTCTLFDDKLKTYSNEHEEYFSKIFELYHAIRNFLKQSTDLYQVHNLKLLECSQDWFLTEIDTWREASNMKVLYLIEKSINVDKLKPEIDNTSYSSSAIDTMQILYSTKTFWENLELFDKKENLLEQIIYDLCCSVVLYIEKFIEKIRSSSKNGDNFHDLTANLQLVTANYNYVLKNFNNLIQEFCSDAAFNDDEIQSHVKKTEASLTCEVSDYFAFEMKKFRPKIKEAMLANCTDEQATIYEIENIVISIQTDLSASNFQEIKQILWNNILEAISEMIQNAIDEKRTQEFFSNALKIFTKLNQTFSCTDEFLIEKNFHKKIEQIEYKLQCYGQETDQLIHQYYKDRYKMQKDSNNESVSLNSSLTIYCCFIDDTLKIDILNARNLPVNELNKKCDSYVKVRLIPEQKFPNFHSFKTKVQYNTIFPLYDESFQKSLTEEQKSLKDAIVCFTVKEKNLVADACLVEAFLSFEDIPQVTCTEKLQQTHLTLTKLQNNEIEPLKAIQYRSQIGDVQAMEFLTKLGILPRTSLMMKQIYLNIKEINIRKSPKH